MPRLPAADPWDEPKQKAKGACQVCGSVHSYRCAEPGCDKRGAITASTNHRCAGQVSWYCAKHFHDR